MAVLLTIISAAFLTGSGDWTPDGYLTKDEERYVERAMPQVDACTDTQCREKTARTIVEVINLRRELNRHFIGSVIFNNIRATCDENKKNVVDQRDCFSNSVKLSFEEGMKLAGFYTAGVNSSGYSQLRIGLRMKEVEFILGGYGEEISYVSSGGYSIGTYKWSNGRATIIVTFKDDEMRGRSQLGIF